MLKLSEIKIGIIGLGYVGLPLSIEFSKKYDVVGYDINETRTKELSSGIDETGEVDLEGILDTLSIKFSSQATDLNDRNVFIVTVPTPINNENLPDLQPLHDASRLIGAILKKNDIVVYESTVYPGATEEECVPILETLSGLSLNQDFYVGYSPERINPGDKNHNLSSILKVTSGSNSECADFVDSLYKSIINAGTHKASSIKVAEAAKVIENTQRDLNIALINELSMIFNKLDIDTEEVLEAAETKWNFISFRPGLVGGHCIGVDPYYLTYKAEKVGHKPDVILAGRRINDSMAQYVASTFIKAMVSKGIRTSGSRVLILGITFKEDCPDLRNTKVIDVINILNSKEVITDVYDPCCSSMEVKKLYDIDTVSELKENTYDGILVAVPHKTFRSMNAKQIKALGKSTSVLFDLKYVLEKHESDLRI